MEWYNYILYISSTILATFFGASFAFNWERRTKEKEKKQVSLASANRAIFKLSRQFGILNQLKNQTINPVRDDPVAWLTMLPVLAKDHYDLHHDIAGLQFLFESEEPNLLTELLMEEDRFFEALKTLNERSSKHLHELQPKLAALGIEPNLNCTVAEFAEIEKLLGTDTVVGMKTLTDGLTEHVDEGIDGIKTVYEKLIRMINNLFPGEKFIEIKFPEENN